MRMMGARLDQSLPVGNEGAGVVIRTGSSDAAKALMGKTVSIIGGAMYSQYRTMKVRDVMELPAGTTAADGASWFVNPLTALGMTETMRRENHKALVHTAAASNLGQMLNKICIKDGIGLVNIVRSKEQADILKKIGAKHVVDSTAPSFMEDLTGALVETGATIAFDAIGGGKLASQILTAMEIAANKTAKEYSRYGSNVFKQVYIYGSLDNRPTELTRAFGLTWSVSGWLLDAVPAEDRPGRHRALAPARGLRTEDHLCQPLHQGGVAAGGARSRQHRRLQQALDRREIPDQSRQGWVRRLFSPRVLVEHTQHGERHGLNPGLDGRLRHRREQGRVVGRQLRTFALAGGSDALRLVDADPEEHRGHAGVDELRIIFAGRDGRR